MKTEFSKNEGHVDVPHTSVSLTPAMINDIYREAYRLRATAYSNGFAHARNALRRAATAIYRLLFTSEAHRHA